MNYYLKKRLQSNLTKTDMANELGLDYLRYSAIERGDVKMPTNLIEKFNEIINRGKENEIAKTENEIKADEFWQEVSQLKEDHIYVLHDKIKEFNIANFQQLVYLLGYKSAGTIYNYLEGRNPAGSEFKKRLYNFFSDEKNIQIPTEKTKTVKSVVPKTQKVKERAINQKLDKYYEKTDFKKIMKENKITNVEIASAIGVHNSTIANMTSKKYKPSYKIIQGIKDYLDKAINVEDFEDAKGETNFSEEYISKQKLIEKCNKETEENNKKISELEKQIEELKSKNELTSKFIALIHALQ